MDNPWSSPWTADDPKKDVRAEEGAFGFPAGRFEIADPAGVWGDDGFGEWAGDGGESGDVKEGVMEADDAKEDGFLGSEKPGAVGAHRLPSPSAEVDPWAEEASPVSRDAPAIIEPREDTSVRHVLEGSDHSDESDSTATAPHIPPDPPLSPAPVWDTPVDEDIPPSTPISPIRALDPVEEETTRSPPAPSGSPKPPPEAPSLGRGADAVAPAVLTHQDAPDTPDATPGPDGARQASKVQELVDMYDGIAKKSAEAPPEPEPSRRGSTKPGADEEAEDWDEFELGGQPPDDTPSAHPEASEPAPKPPDTPLTNDDATISTLFDNVELPTSPPADLPEDADPLSAFTVPQRRAWYRLSRQGSPLLHDSGDPDNYTRAAWHNSAISRETHAIVRRWMQEGSLLSGRTRAGGVRGSAATFGWARSSSEDPVDLSFLSRRREEGRGRSESESAAASAQPLGAAPKFVEGVGGVRGGGRPFSMPPPPRAPAAPYATEAAHPRTAPKRPSPLVLSTTQPREEDADEEWGEMVSSPAVAAAPAAPGSQADSAVSFGKSGSGSSADSRTAKPEVKTEALKPEILSPGILNPEISKSLGLGWGRDGGKGGHARVQSLPSFGSRQARAEAHPGSPLAAAAQQDNMPMEAGEGEVVEGILSRLPDLSYMLR